MPTAAPHNERGPGEYPGPLCDLSLGRTRSVYHGFHVSGSLRGEMFTYPVKEPVQFLSDVASLRPLRPEPARSLTVHPFILQRLCHEMPSVESVEIISYHVVLCHRLAFNFLISSLISVIN